MKPCCKNPRLVHFNRGSHGHIWSCIACGFHLGGPKLPPDESQALIEFARHAFKPSEVARRKAKRGAKPQEIGKMEGFQLTFSFSDDATNQEIAAKLRARADQFAAPSVSKSVEPEASEEEETEELAPKKRGPGRPAKAVSFDEEEEETEEEEAEEAPPAPKAKAKKPPTKDEVNEACKAHAKRHSFEETKAILQKKFKTTSVGKLDPSQYAAVIAAVQG